MEEIDKDEVNVDLPMDEEQLFMDHVVQNDHQLLYLDTYLRELYKME